MAQKREKEETELKVPEILSICSSTPPVTVSPSPSQLSAIIDDQRINYVRSDLNPPPGVDGSRSSSIFDTPPERTDLVSCVEEKKVVSDGNRSLKRPREANRCSGSLSFSEEFSRSLSKTDPNKLFTSTNTSQHLVKCHLFSAFGKKL